MPASMQVEWGRETGSPPDASSEHHAASCARVPRAKRSGRAGDELPPRGNIAASSCPERARQGQQVRLARRAAICMQPHTAQPSTTPGRSKHNHRTAPRALPSAQVSIPRPVPLANLRPGTYTHSQPVPANSGSTGSTAHIPSSHQNPGCAAHRLAHSLPTRRRPNGHDLARCTQQLMRGCRCQSP